MKKDRSRVLGAFTKSVLKILLPSISTTFTILLSLLLMYLLFSRQVFAMRSIDTVYHGRTFSIGCFKIVWLITFDNSVSLYLRFFSFSGTLNETYLPFFAYRTVTSGITRMRARYCFAQHGVKYLHYKILIITFLFVCHATWVCFFVPEYVFPISV